MIVYSQELRKLCQNELESVCCKGRLDIPVPEFDLKEKCPEGNNKGGYNINTRKITFYYGAHENIQDLFNTVRHEARHAWQRIHFPDLWSWWSENIAFYNLVESDQYRDRFEFVCVHEWDADAYASSGSTIWEKKLSIDLSVLDKVKKNIVLQLYDDYTSRDMSIENRRNYRILLKELRAESLQETGF